MERKMTMDEFYRMIEEKVRLAGYSGPLDGEEIYNEICDEIEDKTPGSYLLMVKKDGDMFFEYKVDVMEDQFNLSYLDIHEGGEVVHVDFDA